MYEICEFTDLFSVFYFENELHDENVAKDSRARLVPILQACVFRSILQAKKEKLKQRTV